MKNLQIKKTYSVNGVEYESKEEAQMAMAKQFLEDEISLGADNVINKAADVIKALRIVTSV
jgi:hypothetical protein